MADQLAVLLRQLIVRRNHLFRNDDDVNRGLRVDVVKGQAALVLVNDLRRDFSLDDLQKDVVGHHGRELPRVVSSCRRAYHIPSCPGQEIRTGGCGIMAWLIGIDEAGYGPNLGPLVMSSVAWRVPARLLGANLW